MTRLGWATSTAAVVLAAVGLLLHWPAVLAVGLTLALVCASSAAYLLRPPELRIQRRITPDRVPKGELVIAHLQVTNRGRRAFPGAFGTQSVGDREVEVELPRLQRGEREVRTGVIPTDRRGRFEVGPVLLRRSDPFHLFVAEHRYAASEELLVLPKVLPFRPLRNTLTRSIDGSTDDTTPHGSMTFHQLREYVPGDDIRKIHWPSTAKLAFSGDLIVRQDVDDAQPFVIVLTDLRTAHHTPSTYELSLDAAASAIVAASSGRAPFQLRTTGGTVIGGATNQATAPALEALALVEGHPAGSGGRKAAGGADAAEAAGAAGDDEAGGSLTAELTAIRRTKGGAALVVVTGQPEPAELSAVAALRGLFQRIFLVSVTAADAPRRSHAGLTTIQGASEDELVRRWNLAMRG